MATTIGRVDFLVDFDGKKLPVKARKIGNDLGNDIGSEASKRFLAKFSSQAQQLIPQMGKTGTLSGHRFAESMATAIDSRLAGISQKIANAFLTPDSLRETLGSFDDLDDGARKLRLDLQELHDTGNLSEKMWRSLGGSLNQALGDMRKAGRESGNLTKGLGGLDHELRTKVTDVDHVGKSFDGLSRKLKQNSKDTKNNDSNWKKLSFNLRQAIVIITAIAGGSGEIAALGSAAGAGLTIFGAAAVTAGVGLGVLAAAFRGVRGPLEDIPAGARPAVAELKALGKAFSGIQDSIQVAFFDGLAGPIENLANNLLPTLNEGLTGIADALGLAFGDLIDRLSEPATQAVLTQIFDAMAEQLPFIVDAIGHLGGAIGNLVLIAAPFVQGFVEGLDDLLARFEGFTGSVTGNQAIQEWFQNGTTIIQGFLDLLGAAGKVLAGLVTPETVKMTQHFLENLTDAMPFIQDLLEVFTQLDPFGQAAAVLNDIGNALKPLLDLLAPIASIIGDSLILGIQELGVFIQLILDLLQPWTILFEILAQITQAVTERFSGLLEQLQPVLDVFKEIGTHILERLQPAIQKLIDKILELLPSPEEFARIIREDVLPAIEDFATWLEDYGVESIGLMIEAIISLIDWLVNDLPGTIESIKHFVDDVNFYTKKFVQFFSGPIGAVQALIDIIHRLNSTPITPKGYSNVVVGGIPQPTDSNAAGGIINSQRFLDPFNIGGESGPEAIVPLMRALNQVDPAVRPLAEFARGLRTTSSSGHQLTVAPGAIVVVAADDAGLTANAVLDRLVAATGV